MTLTETSKIVRRGVIWFGISAVLYYIFLLLLFPGARGLIAALFPPKDPPTPVFGPLPPLEFVEKATKNNVPPTYHLDTAEGGLPTDFPRKVTVYKFRKSVPSFEKGKNAIDTAARLGYYDGDLVSSLKETTYKWRKIESSGQLEINTDTKEISLATPLSGKAAQFPRGQLSENLAKQLAVELFEDIGRFTDSLYKNGTQTVKFGQFVATRISQIDSPIDAQIARVDFFRSINETPILGPDPTQGQIYAFVRKPDIESTHLDFPAVQSHIWEINPQSNATYGIISVADAWSIVSQNGGVLANVTAKNSSAFHAYSPVRVDDIFINRIFLAYYDNYFLQEYLQPVYVFEGKYTTAGTQGGTVTLYYPAVVPEYIQAPQQDQ